MLTHHPLATVLCLGRNLSISCYRKYHFKEWIHLVGGTILFICLNYLLRSIFIRVKNRSRYEMFAAILHFAAREREGLNFTRLMYLTFLSRAQGREYLDELVENSLLVYDINTKKFKITEKGRRFFQIVEELEKMAGFRRSPNDI